MKEIVFAGAGGQGVLTCGLIISDIAVQKGYQATWIPSYGSAMRGGTANCTVKYGDGSIFNPSQEEPGIVLAMNLPSFRAFEKILAPNGCIVVNSDILPEDLKTRSDIRIVRVPANTLAKELNHPYGANIVMTGAIVKLTGDFNYEEARDGMNNMFEKKGKSRFEEKNTMAFETGYNFI